MRSRTSNRHVSPLRQPFVDVAPNSRPWQRYQGNQSGTLDFGGQIFPPFDMQDFFYRCGPVYLSEGLSRAQELFGDLRWSRGPAPGAGAAPPAAPSAPGAPPAPAPAAVPIPPAPGTPPTSDGASAGPEDEDRIFALNDLK